MGDSFDNYQYQVWEAEEAAHRWAAQQEAARRAALTSRQRHDENVAEMNRLRATLEQAGIQATDRSRHVQFTPGDHGLGVDPNMAQVQRDYSDYDVGTSVWTPYLGPTVTVNPHTGQFFRNGVPVGTNISGVGRAGELPGTQAILDTHLSRSPMGLDEMYDKTGGRYPLPQEKMGKFRQTKPVTEEEAALQALAVSGQASPQQLHRLSVLRWERFTFDPDEFKRMAAQIAPPILVTGMTAGVGLAAGPAVAAGTLPAWAPSAVGAGIGAFGSGAMSKWDDPWTIGAGAAGGFLGGLGGNAAAGALGAGPVLGGAMTGASGGAGAAIGRNTARAAQGGEFDPVDVLRGAGVGAAAGAGGGATGIPGNVFGPAINAGINAAWPRQDDEERRRKRNPFHGGGTHNTITGSARRTITGGSRRNPFLA